MRLFLKTLFSKRILVAVVACIVLAFMTGLRFEDPGFLKAMRELTFDYYQRLKPRDYEPAPVRIVDIDEASIAEIGQWPWPRTKLAEMVQILTDLGAAAIVFDMVFSEPDRTSPAQLRDTLEKTAPDDLLATLSSLPDHDTQFAAVLAEAPAVIGFAVASHSTGTLPRRTAGMSYAGENPADFLVPFPAAVASLDILQKNAAGIGSISISRDDQEGVVRRVPLIVSDGQSLFPSLTTEALRIAQGAKGLIVRATGASNEAAAGDPAVTAVKIGAYETPTTGSGELWLYYTPDHPDRYLSAKKVFASADRADLASNVEGQIVLVGASAAGLRDIRATSLGELVPGVSIHAQALEQMLFEQFLSRPDWANGLEVIATFAVGAIVILALPALGSLGTAILAAVIVSGLVGGSLYLFWYEGLLIDPLYPAVTSFLVFAASSSLLFFLTEREKKFVRQAFSQYLSPDLVTQLEQTPDQLTLGGEIRPMTILFMDIRGFTPISEQLTPKELVSFLNTLLSPLSDAIQAEGGTIDKYIGDSIMAFWNAPLSIPDHAEKACRAGLTMLKVVDKLNDRDAFGFKARNLKAQTVRIGIGLNSGEVCVGNMGSARRFNYSVIGDAVNIASRIESSCKAVGAELLVSEDTRNEAPDFAYLEAGEIPLKGKSEPVKLYALLGDTALKNSKEFKELQGVHSRLMLAIKNSQFQDAHSALETAQLLAPSLMDFYGRFEDILRDLEAAHGESSAAQ
ncbi:MAG: adenylate/guanylate cyclase domain-containing protein [Roseibium sp.]|uniref:CHASE2 domain-containing protein n=1 Tax=Roseibium sp. TaxID=1936156 RepID=UPI002629DE20|nr:adenylate/guanylate cyclase domain-containing protein [Roseibium sp.]MCV0426279.1 adenylate/guanylate cyclase domain-containing protein [Roseibium sp.]